MVEPNDRIERYQNNVDHLMSEKWDQGRVKYGDTWVDSHPDYHIRRMEEEFYEFRQAVEHDRHEGAALEELADIVNYGLMFLALHADDQ